MSRSRSPTAVALLAFTLLASSLTYVSSAASSLFSSVAHDAPGISSAMYKHLAPLNSFSILHGETKHHLRAYLPPAHLLSTPSHFHTLAFHAIDADPVQRKNGFSQPFPDRIVLEFSAFDRHFSLKMDLMPQLYEPGSHVTVQKGDETERVEHQLVSYWRKVSPHEWATATLSEDGTFHAVIYQDGEVYQANPVNSHIQELESHEITELQNQSQRDMVVFRHSDMIDQEKNHLCGAMRKPDHADKFSESAGSQTDLDAAANFNASVHWEGVNSRKLLQYVAQSLSQSSLSLFQNCYSGSSTVHKVSLGMAVDYGYYQIWGSTAAVQARVASMIATANIVYQQQLNIFLTLTDTVIQTASGGPTWNYAPATAGTACSGVTINDMLNKFSAWKYATYPAKNTLWHQLTACFPPPGTVGLAWIGVLCNQYYSTGVSSHNSQGWLTMAHEIGHNFGAQHTFQSGQGTTGSIMDYCDGKLPCGSGPVEFHPTYTQPQMCAQIASVLANTAQTPYCIGPSGGTCGNGIVEPGEACDDTSGCCVNCQLKSGAQCSGNTACCSSCQFAPTTTLCEGGQGFCSNGLCQDSICNGYSGITFCGLKSGNPCRQTCKSTSTGACSDAYSTPNLNIADGTVCSTSPYSVCQSGSCKAVASATTPAITYAWSAGNWGDCSCAGIQTRTVICKGSDSSTASNDKCTGTQPTSSQTCTPPSSCVSYTWASPTWSACSNDCGSGTQTASQVCTVQGTGQVVSNSLCDASKAPATSQTCNTQACPSSWQYSSWSQCSASCGGGTQTRTATCYQTQNSKTFIVQDSVCSSSSKSALSQSCNTAACATYSWVYGTWSSCSATCGGGTQTNTATCKSSDGTVVDNSKCSGSSVITQSCNTQACASYSWTTGGWGTCSLTCGGGVQTRTVTCVNSVSGAGAINSYCTTTMPSTQQSCNTQACASFAWSTGQWGACSKTCGGGTQTRTVTCLNQANSQSVADSSCTATKPITSQACNAQACATASTSAYNWWVGGWSTCSSLCNGLQVRYVGCMPSGSFTPVSSTLCNSATRPATTQNCNTGAACYDVTSLPNPNNATWSVSEWNPCTAICGGGFRNRTLTCLSNGGALIDNSKCPQPAPVVALNEVCGDFTCPVFWYTGDFSACSAECGGGMMTRTVECRVTTAPNGPGVSESMCFASTKPSVNGACNSQPCPSYQPGSWGPCSSACGYGVQTRNLTCMTYDNQTVTDDKCTTAPLLVTQQVCENLPCPHWHRENWGQCSQPCGGGTQSREIICRMPHDSTWHGMAAANASLCPSSGVGDTGDGAGTAGVPSGMPPAEQSCNLDQCPAYFWKVKLTGTCSQSCGGGTATGTVVCLNGADRTTEVDGSLCLETKPSAVYNCNPDPCPSYNWFAYTDWSNCSMFCGTGIQTRDVKCRNMAPISNLPLEYDLVADSFCESSATNALSIPAATQTCNPGDNVCYGNVDGEINGMCDDLSGTCVCRLGYGGDDCSVAPALSTVKTNAIYYTQGVPMGEYLEVSWVSSGDLAHISILLMKNGDPLWPYATYIEQSIINTQDYVWTVGSKIADLQAGDGYQIRVWFGDSLYADSDKFEIADPCAYMYCGDHGACTNGTCACVPGYSGPVCAIGPCERAQCDRVYSSCNNDDWVKDNSTSETVATCDCLYGYSGSQCKTPPSCTSKSCKNGADLVNVVLRSDSTEAESCGTCSCLNRWNGDQCQTCALTCENGGTPNADCSECVCKAGYFGSTCDCRYYAINIPLTLSNTAFLDDEVSEARFHRTLANDLAMAAGDAVGVTVEVIVNDTYVDQVSGDVIAQIYFSLECVLNSAMEGGVAPSTLAQLISPSSTLGISGSAKITPVSAAAATIVQQANHVTSRYALAQTAQDKSTGVLLPGQQGSLSQAFDMLATAFSNADSLVYHGVVTANINKNSQITASDPTGQDDVPTVTMAKDPFVEKSKLRVYPPTKLPSSSIIAIIVMSLVAAVLAMVAIGFFWWRRAKKMMMNQEMEMESRVVHERSLKGDKHQNAYEPQTPFTPATPATATNLMDDRGRYIPPVQGSQELSRGENEKETGDKRPLVKSTDIGESSKRSSPYDRALR